MTVMLLQQLTYHDEQLRGHKGFIEWQKKQITLDYPISLRDALFPSPSVPTVLKITIMVSYKPHPRPKAICSGKGLWAFIK